LSPTADISVSESGEMMVATVAGEVDMTNAAYVREELTSAVPNDAHALVIDLSQARYMDSAAIEVLFELSRRLVRRRQQLRLVVPRRSPLRRLFTLIDLGSVAPVHDSLETAVAH
jgi:anti-sigma B factor antagonist